MCFTFLCLIRSPWVGCLLSSESPGFGKSHGCVFWLNSSGFSCCCSVAQSCPTLCNPMDCSAPGFPVLHHLTELAQTHVHRVSDAIQRSYPLPSPSPPTFNLSQHQGLFQESVLCIRWPKYWSFSFSISPTNEYSGLISFRIGWFDLLAVQGTLKSLCQLRRYCLY